jgi:hypothetical protein
MHDQFRTILRYSLFVIVTLGMIISCSSEEKGSMVASARMTGWKNVDQDDAAAGCCLLFLS